MNESNTSAFGSVSRRIASGADGLPQSRSESTRAGVKFLGRDSGSLTDLQARRSVATPVARRSAGGDSGGYTETPPEGEGGTGTNK